jgi:hypothetical protein
VLRVRQRVQVAIRKPRPTLPNPLPRPWPRPEPEPYVLRRGAGASILPTTLSQTCQLDVGLLGRLSAAHGTRVWLLPRPPWRASHDPNPNP